MPTRSGAIPLVVKSYEGRPIKLEGNALYPGGNGGTDRCAQASILNLYDPDRATRFPGRDDGHAGCRVGFPGRAVEEGAANGGEGLAFLLERSTSPSRRAAAKVIAQNFPKPQWFTYDAD